MQQRSKLFSIAAIFAAAAVGVLSTGCSNGGGSASSKSTNTGSTSTTTTTTTPVFTTLDGPAGSPTTVNGINNNGTIVGFTTNNGVNSNFLRSAGGSFTSLNLGDPAQGMANGVNINNMIVGVANNNAFLINNGKQQTLTPPGSSSSIAFGINDSGVIVGQYVNGSVTPGFVYQNGSFVTVNPTTNAMVTNVQSVNNSGIAAGFYSTDGMHQHGFLYNVATKQTTLLPDPSTARTQAGGLFLTQFLGINDKGVAVGYYQTNNGSQFGFLFNTATNTYTFLDDPSAAPVNGVQITQITGIDNSGMICGFYIDANGVQHGFTATSPTLP